MSMHDYIQKTRRLASCIVTKPIDMESQVHARYCLTRAEPGSLEKAFTLALREDYVVSSSYSRARSAADRVDAPEPMEIDAIEASNGRTWSSSSANRGGRSPRPMVCYRCRKVGHRAAGMPRTGSGRRERRGGRRFYPGRSAKKYDLGQCGAPYWLGRWSGSSGGNPAL
ncbi:LOW QUALITY PROTEIN: hypothetical protein PHMEG_00030191 [Phytophthora megakarya]|uniref:CCHC-type domain-containing protein n=1 Tax=Phytophthora megakarya TaxID=4795 RepID=A0A225V0U8_9STRA|nr:LOW QUALITY PROTEIN: hypothetical protein PHMEG_00030191 [Phytophthora megakarya]